MNEIKKNGLYSIKVDLELPEKIAEDAERLAALLGSTAAKVIEFAINFGLFGHIEKSLEVMEMSARMTREHRMRQEVSADGDGDETGDPGRAGGDTR